MEVEDEEEEEEEERFFLPKKFGGNDGDFLAHFQTKTPIYNHRFYIFFHTYQVPKCFSPYFFCFFMHPAPALGYEIYD